MRRALSAALIALAGCSGEPALSGAVEPIRVHGGAFKLGDLPGSPPEDGGAAEAPNVTLIASVNNVVTPGQSNKTLSGNVTESASAVAVRFPDLGTGYWVVVSDAPDPSAPGQLTWSMAFDVANDVPAGLHTLRFAAIDERGHAGTQSDLAVCVTGPVPDNLNACDPSIPPPAAVISLAWDSDVDLDLRVVLPSAEVVDSKHPTTAPLADGGVSPDPAKDGIIDRDSDANCVPDHARRESLVFQGAPPPGTYLAYANLFSACGQQATRFTLSRFVSKPTEDGKGHALEQDQSVSGELLAIDANGGAGPGLFVTSFSFP